MRPTRSARHRSTIGQIWKGCPQSAAEPLRSITSARMIFSCSAAPFGAKIIFYSVHVLWMHGNIPQGTRCGTGRHRCIQRHREQCSPHFIRNMVFNHEEAQLFQPLDGVQRIKFDLFFSFRKKSFQKVHKSILSQSKRRRAAWFFQVLLCVFASGISYYCVRVRFKKLCTA